MSAKTTLQPEVRDLMNSPASESSVRLLIEYDCREENAVGSMEDLGAEVHNTFVNSKISVSVAESEVENAVSFDWVTRVEIEGQFEPMTSQDEKTDGSKEDFHSPVCSK